MLESVLKQAFRPVKWTKLGLEVLKSEPKAFLLMLLAELKLPLHYFFKNGLLWPFSATS